MNRLYKHEVLPKIYRKTFEKNRISCFFANSLDVTNQYRNTVNVPVNQRENTGKSLLNVFNSVKGWVSIDESFNHRGNHYFGDVGFIQSMEQRYRQPIRLIFQMQYPWQEKKISTVQTNYLSPPPTQADIATPLIDIMKKLKYDLLNPEHGLTQPL